MSKLVHQSSTRWAQDEESSDEEILPHDEEEEEDDEEEEEEEEEELEINDLNISLKTSIMESKPLPKPKSTNLSKKERKELQKKEIDELDSILSEFGASPVVTQPANIDPPSTSTMKVEDSTDISNDQPTNASNDKKRKKKKSSSKSTNGDNSASAEVTPSDDVPAVVVDVTAALKNKLKKSNKKGNNVPIAVQEALKASAATAESKSRKKEMLKAKKQSYNEFSI